MGEKLQFFWDVNMDLDQN